MLAQKERFQDLPLLVLTNLIGNIVVWGFSLRADSAVELMMLTDRCEGI